MTLPDCTIAPVIRTLDKADALMQSAVVFGSARKNVTAARDLDVAFVIDKPYAFGDLDRYRKLLSAGARGTSRYGLFDLFLVFSDQVWVRNGDCLGFERAKNARALRQAITQEGEPWAQWRERVEQPAVDPRAQALADLEARLRGALSPALLVSPYKERWSADNPTLGFCSMASEAAWFVLGGNRAGWTAKVQREDDGTTHWWLEQADGTRFDPTADQYRAVGKVPPYERGLMGKSSGFMGMRKDPDNPFGLGLKPGKRAQALLEAAGLIPEAPTPKSKIRP